MTSTQATAEGAQIATVALSAGIPATLPGPHAIVTRALTKRFGPTRALAGIDLTVPEGSVYVLVGPNGAGKTTTLHSLLDVVIPDAGSVEVLGMRTRAEGARVRANVGWVPETTESALGWMRVGRLVRYHAGFRPSWNEPYAEELATALDLRTGSVYRRLSKGEQRRVQLLLALAHTPAVLLLDEPTDGLDPVMRERALGLLAGHIARFPTTIVISTHRVSETERLGDHLGVLRAGRIEAQVDRETLRTRLLRWQLQVPGEWRGVPELERESRILGRRGAGREVAWTIWGEEKEIGARLAAAGATIRQVEPLSLEDAALALLSREDRR